MSSSQHTQFRFWAFLFFFLSGITGLIYEVVWTRLLTLVMGNTHYSVATVLTTFMGGLALGSFLGGRYIDRHRNPLMVYAVLEAAIGIYCILIPQIIQWAFPAFQWIYVHFQDSYTQASFLRFLICGSILLVPTTFMGATLPVLSKFVTTDPDFVGKDVGTLYATNTFGAVAGALSSAFVFMPWLGVKGTIYSAGVVNLAIAAAIFFFMRKHLVLSQGEKPSFAEIKSSGPAIPRSRLILVLACFGLSGVSALIYQVAWNRILSLVLGSSVYAFSLILTTFILGLALGTVVFSRICNRFGDLLKVFGMLQVGIGLTALMALPLFGNIPFINRWVYQNISLLFSSVQAANFLIILALFLAPTFFMGGQFPVVIRLVARNLSTVGLNVGTAYAINTVGTIIGSFLGGFVLIAWVGIQNTILCAILLNVALGILLLALSPSLTAMVKAYSLPLALFLILWGARSVPAWDKAVISSGSYMPYRIGDLGRATKRETKILYFKEGIHTTVTTELAVTGNIFLRVNGKTDASLAQDMRTQLLSGYLPMLFHKNPRSALVIGQGSGITLGAVERFPVKEIDLVEISPAVIEGSRFFSPFNHNALDDGRLRLVLEDGRNHIALTEKKYDVIISEPSNPWISGVGALFTIDFFEMARKRLNPGGIFCIWVHTNMSPDGFKSITRTFSEAFPAVTMWESIVGDDYLLIGSMEPYAFSYEKVKRYFADPVIKKDLRKIGIHNIRGLMSLMMMNGEGIREFSRNAPIHTDDNSLLEFSAPQYIYKDERSVIVRQLTPFIKIDTSAVRFESMEEPDRKRILSEIAGAARSESQVEEIKKKSRIDRLLEEAMDLFNRGDYLEAVKRYSEILSLDSEHVLVYINLGNVFTAMNQPQNAEAAYRRSIAINPHYLFGYIGLAKLYFANRQPGKAVDLLNEVTEKYPGDAELHFYLGLAYSFQKKSKQAAREFETAVRLDPNMAEPHYYLGVLYQKDHPGNAKKHLRQFIKLARSEMVEDKLILNAKKLLKKL